MRFAVSSLLVVVFFAGCSNDPAFTESAAESALEDDESGPAVCGEDRPDVASVTGATDVYFTMPSLRAADVGCRTLASGTAPPVGRLALAFWQMGPTAASSRVTWRVADVTGFSPGPDAELGDYQRGPNDAPRTSAVQMRDHSIGMWINSASTGVTTTGDILPVVAHYDFPLAARPRPFADPQSELSYALEAQVPTSTAWGGGVPYAASVFRFKDVKAGNEGREVWFSISFFDPRGAAPDTVLIDGCSTCSGYPILLTSFSEGTRFGSLAPGSASFSNVPWTGYRKLDYRVDAASFGRALADARSRFNLTDTQLSSDPGDYELVHFNLNPEVYAPSGGGGTIGMSARDITIARYRKEPPRAFNRVVIDAANASPVSELQVFFKTRESDFYDERKSVRVPFPNGGGSERVVADLSNHPDWHGTLTGLRIDPFDSRAADACFNVDAISITDDRGRAAASWTFDGAAGTPVEPFFGWRFSGLERTWSDGRYWGACQNDGDPYFYVDLNLATGR